MAFTKILPAGISTTGTVTLERVETTNSIVSLGSTNQLYINTDTPTVRPTLDLNFERDQRLDSRITFSRDSTATYLGSDGLIKTAQPNIPRFEFDTDGNSLGLLIEESRSNLFTYSEQFDNSAWSKTRTTVGVNSITAPDGTLTADKIIENVGTSQDYILDENATSSVATYTYSFFAKAGERKHIRVSRSTGNQTTFTHYYTLEDSGTVIGGGNIESYANGWYRCYGQTEVTGAGNAGFAIRLENSSTNSIYDGDGTSGFYIWGAQYELGSFPTSYIPTSGSAVTRSADNVSITGTNFTDFYNASESTIFFESGIAPVNNSKYFTFYGSDSGGTELIESAAVSGPGANIFTYADSTVYSNISVTDASATKLKFAAGIKLNDVNLAVNGTLGTTDDSATNPDAINKLIIGNYSSGNYYINTTIKRLTYYPERLSNAQLQNLTS